jgi:hypothetical protein
VNNVRCLPIIFLIHLDSAATLRYPKYHDASRATEKQDSEITFRLDDLDTILSEAAFQLASTLWKLRAAQLLLDRLVFLRNVFQAAVTVLASLLCTVAKLRRAPFPWTKPTTTQQSSSALLPNKPVHSLEPTKTSQQTEHNADTDRRHPLGKLIIISALLLIAFLGALEASLGEGYSNYLIYFGKLPLLVVVTAAVLARMLRR